MTNLFAVQIEYKKKPYIFCASDSQSTSRDFSTKSTGVQKIIQRGTCLIMATGRLDIIPQVHSGLSRGPMGAGDLAARILELSEDYYKANKDDPRAMAEFLVAGKEKDGVAMYAVPICDTEYVKRGIIPMDGAYNSGSGRQHVIPAISRDLEKGYVHYPETPQEALERCFEVGMKADDSTTVNHQLQIGFVSPDQLRMLMPPGVHVRPVQDLLTYAQNLTGLEFDLDPKNWKNEWEKIKKLSRPHDSFYNALETQMHRALSADWMSNNTFTSYKAGKVKQKDLRKALNDRKIEREHSKVLIDAFMKGGLREIVNATRLFYFREEQLLKEAETLLSE